MLAIASHLLSRFRNLSSPIIVFRVLVALSFTSVSQHWFARASAVDAEPDVSASLERDDSVAICVGGRGSDLRGVNFTSDGAWEPILALERFLRKPLAAHVFLFLSVTQGGIITTDMRDYLHQNPYVRAVQWDTLGKHHLQSLQKMLEDGHRANSSWMPTLMLDGHNVPYLFFLLALQWRDCMGAVRQIEEHHQLAYRYVAFTRLDLVWLAEHPPLSVLEAAQAALCGDAKGIAWGLDGEEYSGINDRYLLVDRKLADVVGGLLDMFSSFSALDRLLTWVRSQGIHVSAGESLGTERLLLFALREAGACVQRMTSIASVVHTKEDARLGDYIFERMPAMQFARLWFDGARWEVSSPTDAFLHGSQCLGLLRSCCSKVDMGGHLKCWRGWSIRIYSLQRCCLRNYVAVTLRPSPRTVREWDKKVKVGRQNARLATAADPSSEAPRLQCIPFSPEEAEEILAFTGSAPGAWSASKFDSAPLGIAQCYDVDKLMSALS